MKSKVLLALFAAVFAVACSCSADNEWMDLYMPEGWYGNDNVGEMKYTYQGTAKSFQVSANGVPSEDFLVWKNKYKKNDAMIKAIEALEKALGAEVQVENLAKSVYELMTGNGFYVAYYDTSGKAHNAKIGYYNKAKRIGTSPGAISTTLDAGKVTADEKSLTKNGSVLSVKGWSNASPAASPSLSDHLKGGYAGNGLDTLKLLARTSQGGTTYVPVGPTIGLGADTYVDNASIEYVQNGNVSNIAIKGWADTSTYNLRDILLGAGGEGVDILARVGNETAFVSLADPIDVPDENTIVSVPGDYTFKVADGKYAEKVKVNGVEHPVNQQGLVDLGQLMPTAAGVPADEVSLSVNASGSTTNLSIKGWAEGTACSEKLTELITGNGSADTSHRLLSWYGGALHYLPLGERLAFPDDSTVEKNTEGKLAVKNGARVAKIKVNGTDQTPSADADNRVDLGKVAKSISIGGGDAIDPDENGKITLPISQGTVTFTGTDGLSASGTNVVFSADSSTALTVTATESGGTVTLTFGLRYK